MQSIGRAHRTLRMQFLAFARARASQRSYINYAEHMRQHARARVLAARSVLCGGSRAQRVPATQQPRNELDHNRSTHDVLPERHRRDLVASIGEMRATSAHAHVLFLLHFAFVQIGFSPGRLNNAEKNTHVM